MSMTVFPGRLIKLYLQKKVTITQVLIVCPALICMYLYVHIEYVC